MPSGVGIAIFAVPFDFVERRPRDAAGEHPSCLVDPEPMHAVKRRAG
jgi:hypothetical protein